MVFFYRDKRLFAVKNVHFCLFSVQTIVKVLCQIIKQFAMQAFAGLEFRAQRIQCADAYLRAFDEFGSDFRGKLRFVEQADDFVVLHDLVQLADAFGAWLVFGINTHDADRLQAVFVFKIGVGVVEDHVGFVAYVGKPDVDALLAAIQFGKCLLQIAFVAGFVVGVKARQFGGYGGQQGFGCLRA